MSITKSVLATTERPVRLLYANRDRESVIFDDASRLAGRHPGTAGGAAPLRHRRRFPDDRGHRRSSSGPPSRPTSTSAARALSWTWWSPTAGARASPRSASSSSASYHGRRRRPGRNATGRRRGHVAIPTSDDHPRRQNPVVDYHAGDTLLDTARRGGLRPPFSCEAGNCATCMAFLKEGSVANAGQHALTPQEVQEGWVLTCQSVPTGRVDHRRVRGDVTRFRARVRPGGRGTPHRCRAHAVAPNIRPGTRP